MRRLVNLKARWAGPGRARRSQAQQLSALAAGQGRGHPGSAGPGSSEWKTTWPQTIDKGAGAAAPPRRTHARSVGRAAPARALRGTRSAEAQARRVAGEPGAPGAPAAASPEAEPREVSAPGCWGGVGAPGAEGRSGPSAEVGSAQAAMSRPRWRGELCVSGLRRMQAT